MADIPINDVTPRIQLVDAPGGTSVYAYPFPIFAEGELVVEHTVKLTGVTTVLTLTTEYAVSGVGAEGGGNVTLVTPSAIDDIITIWRDVPVARLNDFPTQGDFAAATLNKELDTMTMIMQQLERDLSRTLRLSSSDVSGDLILPDVDDRKGKYLFFDSTDGSPTAAQNLDTGTAVITPFMETVLDDGTDALARATLGALGAADLVPLQTQVDANEKGRLLAVDVYTANGTWTKPADTKSIEVSMVGGGAGGGGADTILAGNPSAAAGGGGGGSAFSYLYKNSGLAASYSVTVGAKGTGGTDGSTDGTAGTFSSFGGLITAGGGTKGLAAAALAATEFMVTLRAAGGTPGGATTYEMNGQDGGSGVVSSMVGSGTTFLPTSARGGKGGDSMFGYGSEISTTLSAGGFNFNCDDAQGFGAGGGGGASLNGSAVADSDGGDGSPGIVIVKSYG